MRGRNLIKLLKALELFSKPEGTTIEEMAEYLEVDRRSVYRMISLIEELGFPIYDEKIPLEKEKRWKLEETYLKKLPNMKLPDIKLTISEIMSLYMLKNEAVLFKGTDIEKQINLTFEKISMFVPKNLFDQLKKIRALFVPSSKFAKDYSGKEYIIEQLMQAMLEKKTCYVKYHSFYDDKEKDFKIDPLHFFENVGGLYLFVRATTFGDILTLAVERIQKITETGSSFEYPKDFDPEELLESAFDIVYGDPIDVKIWFSADQARYIKERKWSKTQKIEDQDDGSIILSMNTSGWFDIKRWVLSYGTNAKVLEPEKLRKEIIDELEVAKGKYM
ncbi:MAG: transcriptional regulator [Desulfobacteraceae bacterium]|nr:transcriptional regulator [Desulfobacteraceae bacterium]